MLPESFLDLLCKIQTLKCEKQTLELKSAHEGCPKHLYDTISSFSNQDDGGIIVFGVDESSNYKEVGVYDPQDIQKKINEQCLGMIPVVRPVLTVVEKEGKSFVAAEIPGIDITLRPCYYGGKGKIKGSYIRIGDSDEPMTDYEIYSYEAYRKKYQDDIRIIPAVQFSNLTEEKVIDYLKKLKLGKPNLTQLDDATILNLMSIKKDNGITLAATMLFCPYPQAFFPQLCITAISVPGTQIGQTGTLGERFIDNKRIEGTIPQMLEEATAFVQRNMKIKTIINPKTAKREDKTEYPLIAVREAVLNALVHRDYSIHTEGMPIRIEMYTNRIEIHNPGGLYGRLTVSQLGKVQADTRNPVLATALETLGTVENRYSGIPTIINTMDQAQLPPPVFLDKNGSFTVILYNENGKTENHNSTKDGAQKEEKITPEKILDFCKNPKTRDEILDFLGLTSPTYAIKKYIFPLADQGLIKLTKPETPGSSKQKFYTSKQDDFLGY